MNASQIIRARRAKGVKPRRTRGRDDALRDYGERDAEHLVVKGSELLGLPTARKELESLRKGDERKALLAALIRRNTGTSAAWIADRLAMGHPGSVSRLIRLVADDSSMAKRLKELDRMFENED